MLIIRPKNINFLKSYYGNIEKKIIKKRFKRLPDIDLVHDRFFSYHP